MQTEFHSTSTLISAFKTAEETDSHICIVIEDEANETYDFIGLVTLVSHSERGVWLQDTVHGHTIFLSDLIHSHQRGVEWQIVQDDELEDVLGAIHCWHANSIPVGCDLYESAEGQMVLECYDKKVQQMNVRHNIDNQ